MSISILESPNDLTIYCNELITNNIVNSNQDASFVEAFTDDNTMEYSYDGTYTNIALGWTYSNGTLPGYNAADGSFSLAHSAAEGLYLVELFITNAGYNITTDFYLQIQAYDSTTGDVICSKMSPLLGEMFHIHLIHKILLILM